MITKDLRQFFHLRHSPFSYAICLVKEYGYLALFTIIILITLTSCQIDNPVKPSSIPSPTLLPTSKPTAEGGIATAMVALIIGTLENEDGCLIVRGEHDARYTLVWPADISAEIDDDKVIIVNGLVRGKPTEIQFTVGDEVYMSGGVAEQLSPELVNTIPNKCVGPFWVVGFEIKPVRTTETPK